MTDITFYYRLHDLQIPYKDTIKLHLGQERQRTGIFAPSAKAVTSGHDSQSAV